MNLVDYGYAPQSMAYLESIGQAIVSDRSCELFSKELCQNVAKVHIIFIFNNMQYLSAFPVVKSCIFSFHS